MHSTEDNAEPDSLDASGVEPKPSLSRMIAPLTGIRGYAALWVVLYHQRGNIQVLLSHQPTLVSFANAGYLGVDLFAILSGFVISLTYGERLQAPSRRAAGRYLWLRLARIYPLHLFALFLSVVAFGAEAGLRSLEVIPYDDSFWRQLFLVNGWGFETRWDWNVPSWTVSSEWFCYIAFIFFAPMLARIKMGWVAAVLAYLTLLLTSVALVSLGYPDFNADLQWGLLRIAGEFLAGCFLYRAHAAGFLRNLPWGWIGLLALAGSLFVLLRIVPLTIMGFALVVYALAQDRAPLRLLFGNRVSVFLGEISFSIYMLHWLFIASVVPEVVDRYHRMLRPAWIPWLVLLAVIGISTLTYYGVERPSRRVMRQWIDRRSARASADASASQ